MTIDLNSGTGLFDRLGKIGHLINTIHNRFGGSSAGDFPTELNDVFVEYDAETNDLRNTVDGLQEAFLAFQGISTTFISALKAAAQNTLIEMADADNPLPSRSVADALAELVTQMTANSKSVDASAPTVAITEAAGNVGDGEMVVSLIDGEGLTLENVLAEDLVLDISTTTTSGAEKGTMRGEDSVTSNKLSHLWPKGSGASKTITARNPSSAGLLTNGDFELFTTNNPDSWTIDVGVAGTDVTDDAVVFYRGLKSLELDGDGATLSAISQDLSAVAKTSRTPYPVCVRIKADVVPAAGSLVIDLYDGSSVINDDAGTANSLTIDLTSVTTSFVAHTAMFRLPDPISTTVKIRVRLATAISSGSSIFIDDLILGPAATQMYTAGPYVSLIRGNPDLVQDDRYTAAITNARDGAFQELFDKLFELPAVVLPSNNAGAETVVDSLIG